MKQELAVIQNLFDQLYAPLERDQYWKALYKTMIHYKDQRPASLKQRDLMGVKWLNQPDTVGMMLYVDLFNGDLAGLHSKLDYFKSLGITLLHLMPLLEPRLGENDGGYAVKSYRQIDPRIGKMEDFEALTERCHQEGIRLCIDYVVNHTSEDHEWALKAKEGHQNFKDYYFTFDTNEDVQAVEAHLEQVFPKVAPGNFTYNKELNKWVMTTFYPYQWDLNYGNPQVLIEMVENLLFLANKGVDMIRLDAIPYIWKQFGTNCRNLPQVHIIMALFRAVVEWVAPSVALLGEVIMAPQVIVGYFGHKDQRECHSLYNAAYMVELWNALATRDARHLLTATAQGIEGRHWINYARCHDDIGWGLNENHLRQLGFDPQAHKSFLIDFYYGTLAGSFSLGELYEFNPTTMDARNSGTLASLAGLERAIDNYDDYQIELAIKRIRLIHALILFRKGMPMLYSGDELAQLNDYTYKQTPSKAHDSRWLHRPHFDWSRIEKLEEHTSVMHQVVTDHSKSILKATSQKAVFTAIKTLIYYRKAIFGTSGIEGEEIIHQSNQSILVLKLWPKWLLVANVTERSQSLFTNELKRLGIRGAYQDCMQNKSLDFERDCLILGPYEIFILKK